MKVACDKCLRVEDYGSIGNWLKIQLPKYGFEFLLCEDCQNGFWRAVDNHLPPIESE